MDRAVQAASAAAKRRSAWRIEGTLREFAAFTPRDVWFDYPVHRVDTTGVLKDQQPEFEKRPWQRAMDARKPKADKKKDRRRAIEMAYEACTFEGDVTVEALAEYMGVTERTVRNRIKEHGGFVI